MRRLLACAIVVCGATAFVSCARSPQDREVLREVYTPSFARVPPRDDLPTTIAGLRADLAKSEGQLLLSRLPPDQSGVLWLALLITLLVAFNFDRLRDRRNIDLCLFLALGVVMFNIMGFFPAFAIPRYWVLLDAVFCAVVLLNLTLLVRAFLRAGSAPAKPWTPNVARRPLVAVAIVLLTCDALAALTRRPDDAGWFINLGAQRLRERGTLPYGDPLLTGTAAAAYGPILYLAHVPFQFAVAPRLINASNASSSDHPLDDASPYYLPPLLATKLCTIALHLLAVFALFRAGRRLANSSAAAWAIVALYCGSAFVLGVGGITEFIGGMTFVSHIGPTALALAAFACLGRPAIAGALLAIAGGAGFYPFFFAPAWAGYYWNRRPELTRFVAGFVVAAVLIGIATIALSRPARGRDRIGTIVHDTLGHHTDPQGYGASPFGFWGQREGVRRWLSQPLAGGSGLTAPMFLAFVALALASFVRARGRSATRLALITGAIAIGASLLKVHPTGTYVAWAYPFLLIGFLLDGTEGDKETLNAER